MAQVLSLENVTLAVEKENSKQAIVKHVSFFINEGEIVALVGESGSGKSVTAQSIIGLNQESIQFDDGNISFESKDLTNLQESEWNQIRGKDISFIFQDPLSSLNPTMKVGRQITEVILQHLTTRADDNHAPPVTLL
ncbi:ATP-binding cassette domain-containing protein, partial [Bacillus cereus]|uniref:ATP-binding cassette domain-containing protein n=1 Tax=Bacillus cereus TaxID=1396 RepID=UPI0020CEE24A|nr:ATP-binding cassette domain-containing protein [Bacillus cereus]